MSKELKSVLLSCVFGIIFSFIVININYKEEDTNVKKEEIVEVDDIGIKEKEDVEDADNKNDEEKVEEVKIKEKEESVSIKKETKTIEKVEDKKKEKTEPKVEETKKTEKKKEEVKEEKKESSNLVSLGKFKLTAYCPCSKCCGEWAGSPTASGVMPRENHTIAVDTSVIPFGTKVVINGKSYVAEDTGSAIKGNKIDVYFDSHSKALNFGVKYAEVFVVK